MAFKDDFKAFILRGNVIDLAIAVVVGGAFGKIVTAFVEGLVMPLVEYVMPQGETWKTMVLGKFKVGLVLGATVDFLIVSLVIFLVLVKGVGFFAKKPEAVEASKPAAKTCPECLESIPSEARRCRHCTSSQA